MGEAARVLKIEDWTPGTPRQQRPSLKLVSETTTAGEIIAARVNAECRTLDAEAKLSAAEKLEKAASWLVFPGGAETELNGKKRVFGPGTAGSPPDSKAQIAVARKGLESGQFIMLFDGRQVEDWEERITIREESLVTFIKLIPLRGG